jgi:large subunit ribosomal protein L9e
MKTVYAHFPINTQIIGGGKSIDIRNFLGEKMVRNVQMLPGTLVSQSTVKDELIIQGNSLENVAQSAALINGAIKVKNKDIRKFLDGVYVSERQTVEAIPE